jgi:transmembrane sensor
VSSLLPTDKTEARCLVEAAAWRARLSESDLESTPEFASWLLADTRHQAAWDRVQGPWRFIGEHQTSPELLELRRVALANAHKAAQARWRAPADGTRRLNKTLAAGVVLLACAALFVWYLQLPDTYSTQRGERRVVTLADGSQIQLDSSTDLQVRYSARARELTLLRGQARFDVAHDVERPFSVTAAGEKVVATGTAFNVDLHKSQLVVTLIEGHVVVLPQRPSALLPIQPFRLTHTAPELPNQGSQPGLGVELDAGQQLVVSSSGTSSIAPANIERSTAWQGGRLDFDNEPLSSVVEQVNRYARQPLVLTDDRAAQLRISGVFSTSDIDGFVDTLTRYLPVDADRRDGAIHLSHR